MTNALKQAGYEVSIATNGNEGLTMVMAQRPQCLILDVILPGINGYTVCRQVRAADPRHTLPIIMVSTKSSPLDQKYGLSLGADRYLAKPFTIEVLQQTVWDVLPAHVRAAVTPAYQDSGFESQSDASQTLYTPQHSLPEMRRLIPRRRDSTESMWLSSPFAGTVVIADKQIRRVYAAIDGKKSVEELCAETHLDMQTVLKVLRTLFEQRRIEFFDHEGRLLDRCPFPLS